MSWIENVQNELFDGYNLTMLKMDEAWLNITSTINQRLYLYELQMDCFRVWKFDLFPVFINKSKIIVFFSALINLGINLTMRVKTLTL